MKLNNLDDFTKNNWYITTTASTIIDNNTIRQQLKEPQLNLLSSGAAVQPQNYNNDKNNHLELLQVSDSQIPIDIVTNCVSSDKKLTINTNKQQGIYNNIIMPATTTDNTITTCTTTNQQSDILAVEELVYEIKENLRLKARPKSQNGRSSRPSPYHIPCRSWNDQQQQQQQQQQINTENLNLNCNYINNKNNTLHYHHNHHNHHHHHHHKKEQDIDDPYELLQTLLKSKNLVKEAVRRLQLNNISPKQKSYFYDSDDDQSSRSPMFRMCQLEL